MVGGTSLMAGVCKAVTAVQGWETNFSQGESSVGPEDNSKTE